MLVQALVTQLAAELSGEVVGQGQDTAPAGRWTAYPSESRATSAISDPAGIVIGALVPSDRADCFVGSAANTSSVVTSTMEEAVPNESAIRANQNKSQGHLRGPQCGVRWFAIVTLAQGRSSFELGEQELARPTQCLRNLIQDTVGCFLKFAHSGARNPGEVNHLFTSEPVSAGRALRIRFSPFTRRLSREEASAFPHPAKSSPG